MPACRATGRFCRCRSLRQQSPPLARGRLRPTARDVVALWCPAASAAVASAAGRPPRLVIHASCQPPSIPAYLYPPPHSHPCCLISIIGRQKSLSYLLPSCCPPSARRMSPALFPSHAAFMAGPHVFVWPALLLPTLDAPNRPLVDRLRQGSRIVGPALHSLLMHAYFPPRAGPQERSHAAP